MGHEWIGLLILPWMIDILSVRWWVVGVRQKYKHKSGSMRNCILSSLICIKFPKKQSIETHPYRVVDPPRTCRISQLCPDDNVIALIQNGHSLKSHAPTRIIWNIKFLLYLVNANCYFTIYTLWALVNVIYLMTFLPF